MLAVLRRLWREEDGQGMTEYGLILALVAVLLIGSLLAMKDKLAAIFNDITTGLEGTNPRG
ncbi:Flp family type IVb pilin [Calderihabitans maritimus]|uniref:Flp/Fap pilin protein n=1 Tax=Calderihabitans maritimus TaxID=1246530 RepID=A0A1Z5HTI2_9FIRM|nr:Flp family type IVb pilin [Calderihabitans maritimus]GAW92834.1 Flp/Fap pilin protein [Calderihabitans maritimus]